MSCRLPGGHPEGFLEAFANVYTAAYEDIIARAAGRKWEGVRALYPTAADGVDGINFVTQCVTSTGQGAIWVSSYP
jgi:hypothetical protein